MIQRDLNIPIIILNNNQYEHAFPIGSECTIVCAYTGDNIAMLCDGDYEVSGVTVDGVKCWQTLHRSEFEFKN